MSDLSTYPAGLREHVALADYTTLGLGGQARYFLPCPSVESIREGLLFAGDRGLPVFVLGGGSNIVVRDEGFPGLVMKIALRGVSWTSDGPAALARVASGEMWDDVVRESVGRGCAGIECLSGIPGTAGATPIQNVGAYGQDVSETIVAVEALDRDSMQLVDFSAEECGFGYRQSRFKSVDADRFVVCSVTFQLRVNGRPRIAYPELEKSLSQGDALQNLADGAPVLGFVRDSVLALRRSKSMVIDPSDPNTRSVGSFFTNPFVSQDDFRVIQERWRTSGHAATIPSFPASNGVKIPAGWLVEQSGYPKGTRRGGAAVSSRHALALINAGGTAEDLLALARDIQNAVRDRFGVDLDREPIIV